MWKTLLVPHDFSACADAALALAARLAREQSAEVILVHVSDVAPNVPRDADEAIVRGASLRLEELAAPLRSAGLSVATRARIGDVCDEILSVTEDDRVSALVMGTHGRDGLARALVGSVAERVLRRAPVPVVVVRAPGGIPEPTAEEMAAEDDLAG
jgi:nucleotide-binding universal stress UspA family protein